MSIFKYIVMTKSEIILKKTRDDKSATRAIARITELKYCGAPMPGASIPGGGGGVRIMNVGYLS